MAFIRSYFRSRQIRDYMLMSIEHHQFRNCECNQLIFLHIHHIDVVSSLGSIRNSLVWGNRVAVEVLRIYRQEISYEHLVHGRSVS